jgi:hypothetical protein
VEEGQAPAGGSVAGETSEPNFDADAARQEVDVAVDVTANSDAFSGLDKGGEGKLEVSSSQSQISSSKSQISNLKSGTGSPQFESGGSQSESTDTEPRIETAKSQGPGFSDRVETKSEILNSRSEIRPPENELGRPEAQDGTTGANMIGKGLAASALMLRLAVPGDSDRGSGHALAGVDQIHSVQSASRPLPRSP